MKRTRVLGGLLAASVALVAAVVLCLPASARQTGVEPVQALRSVPTPSPVPENPGAMSCTCVPTTSPPPPPTWNGGAYTVPISALVPAEKKAATPKEVTVDELIARLAELKTKEAELTDLLRAKLLMQQNGLKKLKKLGISIEEENAAPIFRAPPGAVPTLVGPSTP